MWIYIVDMHFHILADVFFFDNMNYSSKLFNPTSFVIEPKFLERRHVDMSTRSVNMLSGPLYRELLAFSLPIAVTAILEQLFNATDTMVHDAQKERGAKRKM